MNVVFVPEDPTYDRHIIRPTLQAMMEFIGQPHATIEPARGNLQGYDNVRQWDNVEEIIDREPMADLVLVCIDRDGDPNRRDTLRHLEQKARRKFSEEGDAQKTLIGIAAHQEIEVWALGGLDELPTEWSWENLRTDPNSKQHYFDDLAERRSLKESQFGGRKVLGEVSAANYRTLRQKCPEFERLEQRIDDWL